MTLAAINLDIGDFLGALVWIAIFVAWVVGKILGGLREAQKGRTGQPPDHPSTPGDRTGTDELRDFLETLTGQKVERPEEVEQSVRLPPPPPPAAPTHTYRQQPRQPAPAVAEIEEPMKVFRPAQIRGADPGLLGVRSLRLPGSSLPKADLWTAARKHVPAGLTNREELRRAMIQRIILSPPVGLGGKPSSPDLTEY